MNGHAAEMRSHPDKHDPGFQTFWRMAGEKLGYGLPEAYRTVEDAYLSAVPHAWKWHPSKWHPAKAKG